jgi:Uma2 family endonuclease
MERSLFKGITIKEYLETERAAVTKHEYYRGETFAMSGARRNHNEIQSNMIGEVRNHLKDKGCRVYGSDFRVHIPSNTLFTYPDVVIVCGEPQMLDDDFDTLLNPTVLIEILSPSTQSYDRGDKFNLYRSIASLQHYILIASESVGIEQYSRQKNGQWLLQETISIESALEIQTIEVSIPLSEIYAGVDFKNEQ